MTQFHKPLPPILSGFDGNKFGIALKTKRGQMGLREAAALTNCSASTLSRVERGEMPDLLTYVALCRWLEVPLDTFIIHYKVTLSDE